MLDLEQGLPHSMLVQSTGANFNALYKAINDYLSKGYAVVYSAEQASSVQILRNMIQSGVLPDAEDFIQSRMLTIFDEKTTTNKKIQCNATELVDLLFSTAAKARRKSGAKKVVVICNTSILLDRKDYSKQIEFEQSINQRFNETDDKIKEQLEVICCYNHACLRELSLRYLVPMINAHANIITIAENGWKYNPWYPTSIMKIISKGIEKSLDSSTAYLILKTLKLVYKVEEKDIISNPALFEETLRKMIGNNAAEVVLASIMDETARQLLLLQQYRVNTSSEYEE